MKKMIALLIMTLAIGQVSVLAQKQWNKFANLPGGGSIKDIASDNKGTVYVLTSLHSLIFYTTDNGFNWTQMPNTSDLFVANDIEVEKTTGNLYLGSFWFGVERTADKGLNWDDEVFHPITGGFYANITNVACKAGTKVVVANELIGSFADIHISTDGGISWAPDVTAPFSSANDLEFLTDGTLLSGSAYGIYRSTDNGFNWSASGMSFFNITGITQKTVNGHIFVSTNFSSISGSSINCGVYRSTDNGATWTNVSTGLSTLSIKAITFDSLHNKLYAVSSDEVFESGDEGTTWTEVVSGLTTPETNCIAANNTGVFLGTARSGVAFSSAPISGWGYRNHGIGLYTLGNLLINYHNHDMYSIDQQATGVYKLNSTNWTQQFAGLPPYSNGMEIINDHNDVLYATYLTDSDGVFRSTDHGSTWTNIAAGIPGFGLGRNITYTPRIDNHNNLYLIANVGGFYEVYRSRDSGNTWTTFLPMGFMNDIRDLDFNSKNDIYVTYQGPTSMILVSRDDGATYDTVAYNLTDLYNAHLTIAPNDSLYLERNNHIYKRDGINNWFQLPDAPWSDDYNYYPLSLFIDKNNDLFASSDKHGVYYCEDDSNWTNISVGLPVFSTPYETFPVTLTPSDIKFDTDNTPYAVCTNRYAGASQGIYKFSIPNGIKTENKTTSTISIYPNPCTEKLYVHINSFNGKPVIIQVYNTSGQVVITQTVTSRQSNISVAGLSPGIYFTRIIGNDNSTTVRFLKM